MEKNRHALDTGGGGDVKIGSDLGLERFQAQPIWEMSALRIYKRVTLTRNRMAVQS